MTHNESEIRSSMAPGLTQEALMELCDVVETWMRKHKMPIVSGIWALNEVQKPLCNMYMEEAVAEVAEAAAAAAANATDKS